ncbi:MAG: 50S ribosomal protein L13 [Zetaproteobacteria bacterium]|mgnify:CR=1 FL=1|nr:50S ribosomal protein L13 [Pseudobdellovibrionaceae bacterium]|tara:strand:- start:1068 stop:1514 length:447 start_codon:yes stop_codon:yes gene_type:complete
MKTHSVKAADIKKKWLVVDVASKPLGRISSEIAHFLRGKHKPSFVPHLDCGDNVVVINANKVSLSGRKLDQKVYYRHSGYIGGIKATTAREMIEDKPENMIRLAVKGMLPKNKLANQIMKNLRIYPDSEHPHSAQNPESMPNRLSSGE